MKAEELRIKSKYYAKSPEKKEWESIITLDNYYMEMALNNAINIKPIPLTEEWLLKFGFQLNSFSYNWENESRISFYTKEGYSYFISQIDNIVIKEIETVHQLQNLYFALTGEELKTK